MKLLVPQAPPEFTAIARAFAQASRVSGKPRQAVKIGLVCNDQLVAAGELHGFRQAACFSEYMAEFGWHERLLGEDPEMHGCDVVFWCEHTAQDEPSFIRRPAVQLWA